MSDASLYDTDYVAWTEAQAEALRAHGRGGNAIDYELLAEEIEDMGKSEWRSCRSLVEQILIHLAKLAYLNRPETAAHWSAEVIAFRVDLERDLTRTLENRLRAEWPEIWTGVRRKLVARLAVDGVVVDLPQAAPFTFEDVLGRGEDWLPTPTDAP